MNRKQWHRDLKRRKLVNIMRERRLTCKMVAEIACVKEQTVRTWRTGRYLVPESALKLLNSHQ